MLTPPSCRSPHSHGHPLCAPLIACPRFHALSPLRTNGGTVHLPSPFRLGYATPAPSLRTPPRPHALPLCAHAGGCRRDSAHPQPSPHGLRQPRPPAYVPRPTRTLSPSARMPGGTGGIARPPSVPSAWATPTASPSLRTPPACMPSPSACMPGVPEGQPSPPQPSPHRQQQPHPPPSTPPPPPPPPPPFPPPPHPP